MIADVLTVIAGVVAIPAVYERWAGNRYRIRRR